MNDLAVEFPDISFAIPKLSHSLPIVQRGSNKPTGWIVDLCATHHPQAIAFEAEMEKIQFERQLEAEKRAQSGLPPVPPPSNDGIKRICSRIIGWNTFVLEGKTYVYSPAAAFTLFSRDDMGWALAQVWKYINEAAAFMNA